MVIKIEEGLSGPFQGSNGFDLFYATKLGIGNALIDTGGGGIDVVIGNNNQIFDDGIGILLSSIFGEDSDSLTVVANGRSIGMVFVTISGGAGGDSITSRGSSLGVIEVNIDGGGGNDTFDLQNGTGTVDGGSGNGDLLILDGAISEYTFTETGPNKSGNIVGDTNGTNLMIEDIEQFILNGQQFTFEDLFVGSSPIEVSIADLSQDEGNIGTTGFVFNLTRSGDLSNSLTVQWDLELIDGQADDEDFALNQAPNGQAVFSAGSANAEVLIQVNGDTDFEPNETFTVRLSNPSAGTLNKDTATGIILNDDPEPQLPEVSIEATDANKEEGNEGANPFTFTVTRTGDTSQETTVTWTAAPSFINPADVDDFSPGTIFTDELTFLAGETSKDITLNVNGDLDFEENEGFTVTLSNPNNTTLGQATATGTILNDDQEPQLPEVSIEATDANKEEGNEGANPFTFTVTRTGDTSQETTVTWTAAPTFTNPADVDDFSPGTIFTDELTFLAGETSKDITLNVNGDLDFEENEGFSVILSNSLNGTITQATATGTILNDDPEPEQGEILRRKQIVGETVEGTDASDSYEATQSGIRTSTFDTFGGNDFITSLNEDGAFAAIEFTLINTGAGDDTVSAESQVSNKSAIDHSSINTGADNDTIIATNTADNGVAAIGSNVTINTGDGNDTIIAEAENSVLQAPEINTESGNDTIELRSENNNNGIGTINGGSGDQDLLILPGLKENYLYEFVSSPESKGNISGFNNTNNTNLTVEGVELFQFSGDGSTFAFDDLFSPGEVPGSIGDFVWSDLDGDGFQDEGEPGIEGVLVTLQEINGSGTTTFTNSDGAYEFDDVLPNLEYKLIFSRPTGFEPTIFQADGGVSSDIDSDAGPTINPFQQESPSFVLSPGEDISNIDAGYIPII